MLVHRSGIKVSSSPFVNGQVRLTGLNKAYRNTLQMLHYISDFMIEFTVLQYWLISNSCILPRCAAAVIKC